MVPDGQRRALAERVSRARRSSGRIRSPTATRWSACSRASGSGSTSRTTTSSARPTRAGTSRRCRRWRRRATTPATSTKACTKAGTASAARPSSRRRTWSTGIVRSIRRSSRSGFARRTGSSGCRSTSSRCSTHYAAQPSFIEPEVRRNEILRLVEAGLEDISVSRAGQSWGIPLPFDPRERRLRLVRRAHQLRGGGRLRLGRRAVREVVAGEPAHHRQGHHAVPLRDLAGDADEREAAAAEPGVRARLDFGRTASA